MTIEEKPKEEIQTDKEPTEEVELIKKSAVPTPFRTLKNFLMIVRAGLMLSLIFVAIYLMLYVTSGSLQEGFEAMAPNITSKQRLFLRKNPSLESLKRFDVVFFSPAAEEDSESEPVENLILFARIVGLPGEKISTYNGIVYINNEPLEEPYVHSMDISEPIPEFAIPEGMFFVLVDNRLEYKGIDSRKFGAIPSGNIHSKLLVKF